MSRKELIEIAKEQPGRLPDHLAECAECRELVELFRTYAVVNRPHLPDAPEAWIIRSTAIMTGAGIKSKLKRLKAVIAFDSWAVPHPVGVRSEVASEHRRLRFTAENIVFDLRAEHLQKSWVLVAQIKGGSDVPIVLEADKKVIRPDKSGLYQWSGTKPPRRISLRSDEFDIRLPELVWKNRRLK
ncbi:MAG: hypothetical protein AB1746_07510 [Candidatus Zixiibacteriota bacterium]